ncbi:hypothetical protein EJB05_01465, partial [Eragrostis curvula]
MSAGAELVGMAEYDYDSDEDDLLDYDSDADSHHPSRECMVVEAGGGSRRNVHDVAAQPDLAAAATTADAGAAAEAAPLLVTQAQQETPPASADLRGGDDLERLLQRQHELAEAARRLKEERERLEHEVAQRQAQRERVRAHGREARQRILAEAGNLVPRYTRPSQNVAAAATLLRALPQPSNEDQRRIQGELKDLLDLAAVQQAEREQSSAARRWESSVSYRTPSKPRVQPESSVHQTPEQSGTGDAPPVHQRIGRIRDARDILRARRREQGRGPRCETEDFVYAPRRGGRFDPEEDKPRVPVPAGPRAFGRAILRAPVPQRFRPPSNITKYNGETNPAWWLEDYRLACQAGGATDERFIIRNLPLLLADSARTWLEH